MSCDPKLHYSNIQDEKKCSKCLNPPAKSKKSTHFRVSFRFLPSPLWLCFFLLLLFLPSPHRLPHSPPSLLLLSLELTSNSSERRGRRRGNEKRDGISVNTRKKKEKIQARIGVQMKEIFLKQKREKNCRTLSEGIHI